MDEQDVQDCFRILPILFIDGKNLATDARARSRISRGLPVRRRMLDRRFSGQAFFLAQRPLLHSICPDLQGKVTFGRRAAGLLLTGGAARKARLVRARYGLWSDFRSGHP